MPDKLNKPKHYVLKAEPGHFEGIFRNKAPAFIQTEVQMRCKCGHRDFRPLVRPMGEGHTAQLVRLVCTKCNLAYNLLVGGMFEGNDGFLSQRFKDGSEVDQN